MTLDVTNTTGDNVQDLMFPLQSDTVTHRLFTSILLRTSWLYLWKVEDTKGAMDHRWTDNTIAKGRGKKLTSLGVLFPNWISINMLHIHTYMYEFLFVNNTAIFNDYLTSVLHFQLSGKTVGKWIVFTALCLRKSSTYY
jgi:hypothetical protein